MKKLVVPTGYMNSGSSAITDLIREFEGFSAKYGSHEYVFMHCPNGVFDLEDKLLRGNNAIRSDEALHSFQKTMQQLYDKKYWWVGNYKKTFGEDFITATNDYIENLTDVQTNLYWYYQENTNVPMFFKLVINRLLKFLTIGKYQGKKPLLYSGMNLSYPSEQEFFSKTRIYLSKLMEMINLKNENLILDQFLLPYNLFRFDSYFSDNVKIFVVDRDPRDIFFSNKYVHLENNVSVPYPITVEEFCTTYKKMRKMEKKADNNNILRINFEDLIYKYEDSLEIIRKHLGVEAGSHVKKGKYFNPEISINNTQLFVGKSQYEYELKIIESELKEYLYDFPYKQESVTDHVF